jgi:hypothetical protein
MEKVPRTSAQIANLDIPEVRRLISLISDKMLDLDEDIRQCYKENPDNACCVFEKDILDLRENIEEETTKWARLTGNLFSLHIAQVKELGRK